MKWNNLPYAIIIVAGVGIGFILTDPHFRQPPEPSPAVVSTSTEDASQQEQVKELATISPYCADYYTSTSTTPDPSEFTTARPLSDYTCGSFSDVQTMTFPDGKHLYFVAVNTSIDCGSGGCTYIPLLEVAPGSVKRIRGFNGYFDTSWEPSTTPTYSEDTNGAVFGFLTFDSKNDLVVANENETASCGIENIYQVNEGRLPALLTAAYDTCLGNGTTTLYLDGDLPSNLTNFQ